MELSYCAGGVGPWHKVADGIDTVAVCETRQNVGEPGLWVNAVQFCGFDKRGDDRLVVSAVVGACRKRVLALKRRPDAALDDVGI